MIFTGDKERLVAFYQAVTGFPIRTTNDSITVLGDDAYQVVLHALPNERPGHPSSPRDAFVKPFFEVPSLAEIRTKVDAAGGRTEGASKEWAAGRFRACEAVDPDGNPIQFRELAA